MELLQLRARLRTELLDQGRAGCAVRLERVRLPAGAVQREHELPTEPFAERLLTDQSLELRNDGGVAPKSKIGLDAALERLEAKLGEVRRRGAHRFAGQVGERLTPKQRERLAEQPGSLGRLAVARLFDAIAETVNVELTRLDAEQITGRPSDEAVAELAPKAEHMVLQRPEGGGRRIVAPDEVDELRGWDDSVRMEQQRRDHCAALQAADRNDALAVEDFDRPQNPELHEITKPQFQAVVTQCRDVGFQPAAP